MELTISNISTCPGGGHVHLTVTKNGGASKEITLDKSDFFFEPDEYETVLIVLLRGLIKREGFNRETPLSQIKTAIETEVFRI